MPKLRTYRASIIPVKVEGAFVSMSISLMIKPPTTTFDAASLAEVRNVIEAWAEVYGEPCKISLDPPKPKPAGFDAEFSYHKTLFNLDKPKAPVVPIFTTRPGDAAAAMRDETGLDYSRCLVMTNTD